MEEKETPVTETPVTEETPQTDAKPKKSKKDKLTAEVESLQEQLAAKEEQYLRMLAEYANYKRRTGQEKEQLGEFARADILRQILPLLDNFDRAAAAPDGPEYKAGVDLIVRQVHDLLEKLGVTEISPLGEPFDADIHYAIQREDAPEGVEPDTVTAVLQTGYKLGERLLRPAMVKVAN